MPFWARVVILGVYCGSIGEGEGVSVDVAAEF